MSDTTHIITQFAKLFVLILIIAHWIACWFWALGIHELSIHGSSWIVSNGLLDTDAFEQYISTLYWAFSTMTAVGYGDISPVTESEQSFVNFSMIIGAIVYAYTIGTIGDMVSNYN